MPLAAAGGGIERDHGTRKQVVSLAHGGVEVGPGIAGGPEQRVGLGVVAAGEPRRRGALLPAIALPRFESELARTGNRIESPQTFSRGRVVSVNDAANS